MVVRWDWALARTVLVATGLPFAAVSLGIACLDYAGEDFYRTCASESAIDGGTAAKLGAGSGSGNGTGSTTGDVDCGVPVKTGGGSGSAAPAAP